MVRKAFRTPKHVAGPVTANRRFISPDFREEIFDALIEAKNVRLAWARASYCPCRGINPQAPNRPQPDCPQCNAVGYLYFRPADYSALDAGIGKLDEEQQVALDKAKAVLVRGWVSGMEVEPDIFRELGTWAFGNARLTMRGENRVGYYDRIISIDELMTFNELVKVDGTGKLKTRYTVAYLNDLRSYTATFSDEDIEMVAGELVWKAGKEPTTDTVVSVNYLCHPTWVVMNHIHVFRTALVKSRTVPEARLTPQGNNQILPNQHFIRLEFLPMNPE